MTYFDDALVAETSVMTTSIPPDTSSGGIRINSILKDGGNVVSGAVFLGGTNGTWQSKNVDDALRARGIAKANGYSERHGPVRAERVLAVDLAGVTEEQVRGVAVAHLEAQGEGFRLRSRSADECAA